jgi:hypothetical protein
MAKVLQSPRRQYKTTLSNWVKRYAMLAKKIEHYQQLLLLAASFPPPHSLHNQQRYTQRLTLWCKYAALMKIHLGNRP